MGSIFFDSKPMIVKGWNPEMELHTETIKTLPIWVQFPNLGIKYWGAESLSKLESIMGIALKTYRYTMEKTLLQYARLLIEMPLDSMIPEHIEFINNNEILVRQQVHYEWKPLKCTYCQMFGHDISMCKKKGVIQQEWRAIQRNPQPEGKAQEQPKEILGLDTEPQLQGFTPAARRDAARVIPEPVQAERRPGQRHVLWQDLIAIVAHMNSAWCIVEDFNSILDKEDRIEGEKTKDHEIKDFVECLEACEMNEMRSTEAYYSWTNKTIWSRIDRVSINPYCPLSADFTQVAYLSNGLSDHSPITIQFHDAPKPKASFQFYNMWSSHKDFHHIMTSIA
ncbi:hypothetical protein Cgig2_000379 [Carnegiea gigantea]|uniref:DUF4283 domain-containing protein n=1 Tax=Carnegiea gigantea TaxID=171969 RepID=A0A9Q1JQG5_9CARY|nr:hypothetical protein Cgig2_000379 [Carnegiea gigantea]